MAEVDEPMPRTGSGRRLMVLSAKIIVSVSLLGLLLSRTDVSRLWVFMRGASLAWLGVALLLYLVMVLISAWRWRVLLETQHVAVPRYRLLNSYLVATFFNNFLPSNIGGDVIRVHDTASAAGSKTLATTVILMDRGIGLLGLLLVAAIGATSVPASGGTMPLLAPALWLSFVSGMLVVLPVILVPRGVARLLSPLRRIHQEWVSERIARLTDALDRFGRAPWAMLWGLCGAVAVQAVLVAFYAAIVRSMGIPVSWWHLAVVVPVSFVVQMAPVSVNGFGIREAAFSFYFSRLGLSIESAMAVSFTGAVLIMVFSLSGAVAYVARGTSPARKKHDTAMSDAQGNAG
jgi:hypothetical protein